MKPWSDARRFRSEICADGLVVDVPAGVYHPLPDSSSEFFIRNIKAMNPNLIAKTLEIGAGCGIISLYMAANWTSRRSPPISRRSPLRRPSPMRSSTTLP